MFENTAKINPTRNQSINLQRTGQIGRMQAGGDGWLVNTDGWTEIESKEYTIRHSVYSKKYHEESAVVFVNLQQQLKSCAVAGFKR